MENVTFDLSDLHRYGPAFYDYLKLRKHFFVDALGWNIAHDDAVEMDQYDNPTAHYSLVLHEGRVLGGARCMPTTSVWGEHSYMLRDAVAGKLPDIPPEVLPGEIRTPDVWECTRLVVSDALRAQAERARCLALIVDGLADVARRHGAERLMSLSPLPLMRALRQLGWQVERIGAPFRDGDGRQYAVLAMPASKAPPAVDCPAAHLSAALPAPAPAPLAH
jgi:N-acyl-L-homoserine lactone synthetase